MGGEAAPLSGPDLTKGVPASDIPDGGMLLGHADGEAVLLARSGGELFAVGAKCTHYGGPLNEGLVVDGTVRCPWHHTAFSLRTGEVVRPPALGGLPCWRVTLRGETALVTGRRDAADGVRSTAPARSRDGAPRSVVIVGGGAAGTVAAMWLRRAGFDGPVTIVESGPDAPYDRPNLSKDYLAGTAPEDWIPLRPQSFYSENGIELMLGRRATAIDTTGRRLVLDDGMVREFGALLLATGAEPVTLDPAGQGQRVHYLRTLDDSRAIIEAAQRARRAVVLGASFIGLEVAASLRARGLEVTVVAPESRPLERVLGPELGDYVRGIHERHGVVFRLGQTATTIGESSVTLRSGERLPGDLVVAGIGVRPRIALAESAGLATDRGIVVDAYLETSASGIYAAGDVARWPDAHSGERIRVEHWVVAERQGQTAAHNMLAGRDGHRERFDAVPFFWSQHFDVAIAYVGHAPRWDSTDVEGDLTANDAEVTYRADGRVLAVATVFRDRTSLEAEAAMERSLRTVATVPGEAYREVERRA
jgi:NADPH-dependent 2,4-dienoyl-CoA reductase/sulfur reductase-like enzyme/nitrite reductase/ring-hydroxylating ferredoxin subunit